jgi:hypothetical protein
LHGGRYEYSRTSNSFSVLMIPLDLIHLKYIQANAYHYPILHQITLDYLPVQGSSVPCEHAFSDAGLTDTKRRARLLPENFGSIQTVKGHYKRERRSRKTFEEAQRASQKRRWDNDSLEQATKQTPRQVSIA